LLRLLRLGAREGAREARDLRHRSTGAVVVACSRSTECDVVAVPELAFTLNAFTVDIGAVQAPEVTQDVAATSSLDHAVFFGHDLIEQLNGVARMTAHGVEVAQFNDLL